MLQFLGLLIEPVMGIVDKFVEDKDKKNEFRAELTQQIIKSSDDLIKAQASIITAEANGHSWLQRNWRPMLMCIFMLMLVNEYVIAPFAAFFGHPIPTTPLPGEMWTLLTVGVGGYIAGRSGEKIADKVSSGWKSK